MCALSALDPERRRWWKEAMTDLQERIVTAAYPLFTRNSFHTLTLEEIESAAGISAADFDAEFASLEALGAACLARREREWTIGTVEAGARSRGTTPEGRLLAIFDVFDDWFRRDDFEACTFINVLVQMGKEHPLGAASVGYLSHIRELVTALAQEADLQDADEFARSWHILMKGSILSATEGDQDAALRAQRMAGDLIARHRRSVVDHAAAWLADEELGLGAAPRVEAFETMLDPWDLPDSAGFPPVPESAPRAASIAERDALVLTPTDSPSDLLIRSASDFADDIAYALVRVEARGVFCYPCTPGFPRLGPFGSPEEALDEYRRSVAGLPAAASASLV
jgi:AcrR family transcriptional regulator